MKIKALIVAAAVILAITVVSLWLRQRPQAVKMSAITAKTDHQTPPPFKIIIANPVKMAKVAIRAAQRQSAINKAKGVWSEIQIIVDDEAACENRLQAINRLPSKLTEADWRALKEFLLKADPLDNRQLNQVVKNQLLDTLCTMEPPPGGLSQILAQMYQNLLQNEVIRDYAVQHLATLDEMLATHGGQDAGMEIQSDQQILWNALDETGDSIAGTALLGLLRLSQRENADVDETKLDAAALQLANDKTVGEATQITAYQICARLNLQEALPAIEEAAQNSQNTAVQISAISALGQLGGLNDIPLLRNLPTDVRLKLPVQTALQNIESRKGMSLQSS